jgi:hypothetical protein
METKLETKKNNLQVADVTTGEQLSNSAGLHEHIRSTKRLQTISDLKLPISGSEGHVERRERQGRSDLRVHAVR